MIDTQVENSIVDSYDEDLAEESRQVKRRKCEKGLQYLEESRDLLATSHFNTQAFLRELRMGYRELAANAMHSSDNFAAEIQETTETYLGLLYYDLSAELSCDSTPEGVPEEPSVSTTSPDWRRELGVEGFFCVKCKHWKEEHSPAAHSEGAICMNPCYELMQKEQSEREDRLRSILRSGEDAPAVPKRQIEREEWADGVTDNERSSTAANVYQTLLRANKKKNQKIWELEKKLSLPNFAPCTRTGIAVPGRNYTGVAG